MENDSPNLFDSEPMTVELTSAVPAAADSSDDVLSEMIDEIRGNDEPTTIDVENPVDGEKVRIAIEYHTDESGDDDDDDDDDDVENDAAVEDRLTDPDKSVEQLTEEQDGDSSNTKTKDVHKGLPPGRVKLIMKMDPDVNLIAADAVFLVTKATESFVGLLAQHCHQAMAASNKKTLKLKHIEAVIEENVPFEFLEGALEW